MKHFLPTRIAPYFLFLCVSLFIVGCVEKEILELDPNDMEYVEEPSIEDEQDVKGPVSEVRSEEVPHIIGSISELTGSRSLGSKSVYYKKGVIDMNTILKVKDKKSKRTNYTFPVYVTGQTEGEFFNLIISEDEKGKPSKPYVRHYVVNPDYLDEYLASGEDFAHFKGTFHRYRFNSFFDAVDLGMGSKTLKGSDCDTDGTTVGPSTGGSVYNPELIQVNGANSWYGPSYFGYLNFPSSSAGTSSTTHNTEAYVNNNEGGANQYAEVESTYGIVQIRTDSEFIDVNLYKVIATNVTTTKLGSGSFYLNGAGQKCTIKITTSIKYIDGKSIIVTEYSGCEDAPMQKTARAGLTAATTDCPDGDDGGVAVISVTKKAFLIENSIISTQLDPCSSQILSELKNLQQNDMAMIISRFGTPNTVYDWEIKTENPLINPNNAAETDWKRDSNDQAIDYNYLTHIKPSYINQATQNSIARTILHEMLHAYMSSHLDDVSNGNTQDLRSFASLWNSIRNNLYGGEIEAQQHEFMANKFLNPLTDALKEWDNGTQSNQYYQDLAWGALFTTTTFNHFHPSGSSSRNRILNTNAAEDENSTKNGIAPKGNPCN